MDTIYINIIKSEFTPAQIRSLEAVLKHHYKTIFRTTRVKVIWLLRSKLDLYDTHGVSEAILISFCVPHKISKEKQIIFLKYLREDWNVIKNKVSNNIIISITHTDIYINAKKATLNLYGNFNFEIKRLFKSLKSFFFKSYIAYNIN